MREPHVVTEELKRRFDKNFQDWARGGGSWPMRVSLKPPSTQQRATQPVDCLAWAQRWQDYKGPGVVRFANAKFPTGMHPMPQQLMLARPRDVAAANPGSQHTWTQCGQRLVALETAFPSASFERNIRRITDLHEPDYQRLFQAVTWLKRNPTSGMLLRQLPIEGIHTKWLAKHAGLVLALLGDDENDPDTATASPTSLARLHERLGLRRPPTLIQVAVLDPAIRDHIAGMKHFSASVNDLNQWTNHPHTVVILENKETGYAITDDHPGVVVLHGQGFDVANYSRISWVINAQRVIYWGDIDGPGIEFINDLRANGVRADTILMDKPTLATFQHLAVAGAAPRRRELPHLTEAETDLNTQLTSIAETNNSGILLEQERIPWSYAYQTLRAAIGSPSNDATVSVGHNESTGLRQRPGDVEPSQR